MTKEEILNELHKTLELLMYLQKEIDRSFTGHAGDAIGLAAATLVHAIDQLSVAVPGLSGRKIQSTVQNS